MSRDEGDAATRDSSVDGAATTSRVVELLDARLPRPWNPPRLALPVRRRGSSLAWSMLAVAPRPELHESPWRGKLTVLKIVSPSWTLRSPCPCCGHELVFSTCRHCTHVLLVCAELETIFPDPHDLSRTLAQPYDAAQCPTCAAPVRDYEDATSDQIRALGFTPDEYH
jgi:hypothetical protein